MKDYSIKKRLTLIITLQAVVLALLFCGAVATIYVTSGNYANALKEAGVAADVLEKIEKGRTINVWILIGAMVVIFPLIMLAVRYVVKTIKQPLEEIKSGIGKLSKGELIEIKKYGKDELGEITDALNGMSANMREQAAAAQLVADGDLTVSVTPRSESDVLNIALRQLVEDNNMALGEMKNSAEQVSESSEQVAAASQALAQGSTEQASAITEITASIEDIAHKTRANATDANHANELVSNARNDAELGDKHMGDMITAMSEINESSENISKIIKVIDDIAFQTNILALNAAVEAARAGSNGRGFAVVADEVRNLAGKSAQAASETAQLIENSIQKVNRGSKIAEETAASLKEIVAAIEQVAEIISEIANASNEQATAVNQINQAIGQVSVVIQNNSSTSEECAAASEILSMQALKLREMIGHYKLLESKRKRRRSASKDLKTAKKSEDNAVGTEAPAGLIEEKKDEEIVISLDDNFGKY